MSNNEDFMEQTVRTYIKDCAEKVGLSTDDLDKLVELAKLITADVRALVRTDVALEISDGILSTTKPHELMTKPFDAEVLEIVRKDPERAVKNAIAGTIAHCVRVSDAASWGPLEFVQKSTSPVVGEDVSDAELEKLLKAGVVGKA